MADTQQRLPAGPPGEGRGPRLLLWFLVAMVIAFYWSAYSLQQEAQTVAYSEFKALVRADKVAGVTFAGRQLSGVYAEAERRAGQPAHFSTLLPDIDDPELLQLLETHRVMVNARSAEPVWWLRMLFAMLPWVLILGFIFYFSSKMQERLLKGGGPGGIFGFGQSKARRFEVTATHVSFDDVAGVDNAKRDLQEIVEFLKDPQRFRKLGAKIPRGILLMGPPGTGKTLLAKALAGEAEVPFYSISGSEFIEMFVGVGAARVRDMFESARKDAPAVIFIDEIDSVGRARGTGLGGGHDEREQTLNQILGEMDGFDPHEAVVVLAATNRPDVLDPALMRPGRFDRKVMLDLPGKDARRRILQIHSRDVPLADDVDLDRVAARTVGFSGADLENLVNEAALLAARENKEQVDMNDFSHARDKIVLGAEREALASEDEKQLVAYHESGHALAATLLPHADPLDKVTIIPHGLALGATEQLPEEEQHNLRYSYLIDRIGVMLAGRAAEQVVFGEVSSGAENDLKQATRLARRMVSQWGMSEKLGPAAFARGEEHPFLGREMAQPRDFSEQTARLIDEEVRALIRDCEQRVRDLLEQHRAQLDALATALRERESLSADEVAALLDGNPAAAPQAAERSAR
ncbi:MAG TPA: ATP-dependent zinc metalloprotease FtsH [Thiobacillus sp.]|nr:ATP-dependent zinc metalloprotease FtsH [Thiobacillus sp.]